MPRRAMPVLRTKHLPPKVEARMASRPRRTCAACRKESGPEELIRWVRDNEGNVFPDLAGRTFGRGAWVHPRKKCLAQLTKALAGSFRAEVKTSTPEALSLLGRAANLRVEQLLGEARRQGALVAGADAVREAWERGDAAYVLVAKDARAAANSSLVEEAVRAGRAASWGTKVALGRLVGRGEVGILALRDTGLATRLFGAIAMALLASERVD